MKARVATALGALLGTAALAACHDSTAPRGVDVAVALLSLQGPTLSGTLGFPLISCQLQLTATATGAGDATWLDATFRRFVGKQRTTPADSVRIDAQAVANSWRNASIRSGEAQHASWNVAGSIPFLGELEFRYRPGAEDVKHTKVKYTCGPTITADVAAPAITAISISPSAGQTLRGAQLIVKYTVSAQAGLWQSYVRIGGPCTIEERFNEQLLPMVVHQMFLWVPSDCAFGVPFTVFVSVT